ncbi:MAG: histidinol phosphate phosphatase domain-containing protein [Candidatus Margulisbacteria bacterium]|nr:histidinol phosphate phosphatase domain-containing protein [Candidatus Margulisiibacteriota bacterium]MBU1021938.1 histidinol phosphate phosphatase domain-containing protein [Candidatus Margulisiibacteriota bacterium]MBU1728917.1 histidinol phosphate phosphatase domain-containing protein [Candidatus Margulisiibacteriota bacterium]MBU1768010.1 histidinol phosphate phosphatase domain-containing protein [Candidatus Omnitrophota bacterium]MBU1954723.1 histidinol phosphate phosphatase domain-cont
MGKRVEFHCHTIFSDGILLPAALAVEAKIRGTAAIAFTDHVDPSNIEFAIKSLVHFCKEVGDSLGIKVIPGAEISYIPPAEIEKWSKKARKFGAKIIVVHGQSPVEPVFPGTNHAAVQLKGLVNILAHPGNITVEDAILASKNGIYLELSARNGHNTGNLHVAKMAKQYGAKLLVNTDAHSEKDLVTQEKAFEIATAAGLSKEEVLKAVKDNPHDLLASINESLM